MPYLIGIGSLLFLWLLYRVFSGKWDLLDLAKGSDGLPSSSQFQFLLWTITFIFAYITVYCARSLKGEYGPISDIPSNLLVLMGISGGSMIISKGITIYHISRGTVSQKVMEPKFNRLRYLIADDSGEPALNKLQMMVWTIIAIGIYLFMVNRDLAVSGLPALPDLDDSMLVLMGISQGTYLGKRLVSTTSPILLGLEPESIKADQDITLTGKNFGDAQEGGMVKVGDLNIAKMIEWGNDKVKCHLPKNVPTGQCLVSIIVKSKESNGLTLTVEP
jgi:hypothetical protein